MTGCLGGLYLWPTLNPTNFDVMGWNRHMYGVFISLMTPTTIACNITVNIAWVGTIHRELTREEGVALLSQLKRKVRDVVGSRLTTTWELKKEEETKKQNEKHTHTLTLTP